MLIRIFVLVLVLLFPSVAAAQEKAPQKELPLSEAQIQLSFAPVVKKVSPAVVNIYTKRLIDVRYRSPFMSDPFFGQFFGGGMFNGPARRQMENALGSGVILEPDGLVVTNAHVIENAQEITVVLADGREFEADLALSDPASDLAILRMKDVKHDLPFVSLKPSESLEVGDLVLAIGNPFGVGQTVTSGIVSAQGRSSLDINDFNFFIQTDAAINPGNSGGPLVALDGSVVGVNTAIYSRSGGSMGIGFAIPSEMVASVIAAEKAGQGGKANAHGITRPWLGIGAQDVTPDIAASLGFEKPGGALVGALHKESPLLSAGAKVGDIVTAVNGKAIRGASEMKFRMATVPLGQSASFTISRAGESFDIKVKAIAPPDIPPRQETKLEGRHALNGATIGYINPAVIIELGLDTEEDEGVVVLDVPRDAAAARIIGPGDVLLEINGKKIEKVEDVEKVLLEKDPRGISLTMKSRGRTMQLYLR